MVAAPMYHHAAGRELLAAGFATTAIIPTHTLTGGLYSAIVQATTRQSDEGLTHST